MAIQIRICMNVVQLTVEKLESTLILKEWTGTQYGGKTETGTRFPVTSAYYCRNHLAKKLELLANRYVSNDD
jgi:hypothetical protein